MKIKKEEEKRSDFFSLLPWEILTLILSHLPDPHIFKFTSRTNYFTFYSLVRDSIYLQDLILAHNIERKKFERTDLNFDRPLFNKCFSCQDSKITEFIDEAKNETTVFITTDVYFIIYRYAKDEILSRDYQITDLEKSTWPEGLQMTRLLVSPGKKYFAIGWGQQAISVYSLETGNRTHFLNNAKKKPTFSSIHYFITEEVLCLFNLSTQNQEGSEIKLDSQEEGGEFYYDQVIFWHLDSGILEEKKSDHLWRFYWAGYFLFPDNGKSLFMDKVSHMIIENELKEVNFSIKKDNTDYSIMRDEKYGVLFLFADWFKTIKYIENKEWLKIIEHIEDKECPLAAQILYVNCMDQEVQFAYILGEKKRVGCYQDIKGKEYSKLLKKPDQLSHKQISVIVNELEVCIQKLALLRPGDSAPVDLGTLKGTLVQVFGLGENNMFVACKPQRDHFFLYHIQISNEGRVEARGPISLGLGDGWRLTSLNMQTDGRTLLVYNQYLRYRRRLFFTDPVEKICRIKIIDISQFREIGNVPLTTLGFKDCFAPLLGLYPSNALNNQSEVTLLPPGEGRALYFMEQNKLLRFNFFCEEDCSPVLEQPSSQSLEK